jgi:uncharacterized caspase-like protein
MRLHRRHCLALGLMGLARSPYVQAQSVKRMALVIGSAAYPKLALRHAVKDARAMAASLGDLGYQITTLENASLVSLLEAMKNFWLNSRSADARVVFYAGHAVVHEGRNYLLPVDAQINEAQDVPRMAAKLDDFTDKLSQAQQGVNVVILDACRTSINTSLGARAVPSGLEQMLAPRGTLVAFSTAPGAMALDGNEGNSPYSRHLIAQLKVPGQPIEQMFKRVRDAVAKETADQQIPWENSSLRGDFCLRNGPTGLCPGTR